MEIVGGNMKSRIVLLSILCVISILVSGCQSVDNNNIIEFENDLSEKNQRILELVNEVEKLTKSNDDLKKVIEELENQVTLLYTDVQLLEEQNKKALKENTIKRYNDRQLIPKDESDQDESLKYFVTDLNRVINSKDIEGFKKLCSVDIRLSFGDDSGVDQLESLWSLDTDQGEDLFWKELKTMTTMGGVFNGDDLFTFPYTFHGFPDDLDAYMDEVVIKENVYVYEEPNTLSSIIGILDYSIVEFVDYVTENGKEFHLVRIDDETEGFVEMENLRSPIDYRLGIARVNDEWQITFLLAGD